MYVCVCLHICVHACMLVCDMYMIILILSTAVDCGSLPHPVNGRVNHNAGTTFGRTAFYTCNTGYILVGGSTRTCQATGATGMWSGSAPTCQRMLYIRLA